MTTDSTSFIISPPSPSPPTSHTLDHDLPFPEPSRTQISIFSSSLVNRTDVSNIGNATCIIPRSFAHGKGHRQHRMDYQPQQQQQASGSGSGSDEGKSVPRPLRAPAPGPLNLNFSQLQPQFQFQQQQQQNQQQQQGQGQGQNSGQNQNSYQNLPHGYITPQGYPVGGNNDISPFQNTSTSLPSGSASSSPINQFGYPHPHNHHGQPPFINIEEPMGPRPMIPSEPRMGHYSNYHHSYQPQPYEQWHVPGAHPHPHGNGQQGHGNDQPVISSSRRSTISNPSDQDRVSRPSTTENQNQSNQVKVKDMVKIEPAPMEEDEDDQEEKLDHRKRKRNRTIRSCVPCHNHKRKVSHYERELYGGKQS
jgi:hypothetical protein